MKHLILKLLIIIVALLSYNIAKAYDFALYGNRYKILSSLQKTVSVTGGEGGNIPETVSYGGVSYTVIEIGENAFSGCSIYNLTLPKTIKVIQNGAFERLSLSLPEITIPDGVEIIGKDVFKESFFKKILVGRGVLEIGAGAFYGCSSLKQLVFRSNRPPLYESNSTVGNQNTDIVVPVKSLYEQSQLGRSFLGTVTEPISFDSTAFTYIGKPQELKAIRNISGLVALEIEANEVNAGKYYAKISFWSGLFGGEEFSYDYPYEIKKALLTINIGSYSREYGLSNPPFLNYDIAGFVNDEADGVLDTPVELISVADITSEVGEYPITCSTSARNYEIVVNNGVLSILKAPVIVQVNDAERLYGDSNPNFTFDFINLRNNDNPSLITPFKFETATAHSDVGSYPIVCSEGSLKNYEITEYRPGTLTINKAPLTLTATNAQRTYFEDNPIFDFTVSGLRNGDTKACVTTAPQYNCFASKTSNAGSYEIIPYGAIAQNYVFEYKVGSLIVKKRDLTASIANYSRIYGTDNPTFAISYTGFVNNEDASELNQTVTATCEATKLSDVGTYPIILSGGMADNYNISSYNNGNLTIEKANQTISWNQDLSNIVMYSQVALEAASTSNLPVTYEMSPNNVATLYNNGGIWYLDCYGSGAVSIRATQNGDKNHNEAPIITKTLVVHGNGGDAPSNPQIYLNVDEPGTLSSMIAENRKYQIKNLRLTGNLNGTDIIFIREMAGSDSNGNSTPGILETLDISGCTIVSGGRSYYQSNRTSEYVVGNYMFYNCKVLTTLRLPENSISIGNSAFADCDRLSVLSIPNSVKSFGSKSFANAISLLRIPIPEDLTTIGDMAFMGCNGITELTLPESVSSIGDGVVNGCQNLSQIDVEVGNSHYASKDGVLYDSDFHELLIFPVNHEKTEYSVIDEVTSIAPYAFLNAKKLTTVNLPSSLTSIGKDAFIGCMNLSTLQVKALNPPICQNDCFENVSKTRCELQVPLGCRSYYWVAPVWSEFNHIAESDFSGIEEVRYDNIYIFVERDTIKISECPNGVMVRIYQTNGTLVFSQTAAEGIINFAPDTPGTYIIVIGDKSYKVML